MSRNRNRILNTAGLTGGAQCSAATERKDGHGGVSSLLLMVDFRGGPVWHLMNYWIMGRPSLALNELLDYGEAQLGYFNFFWEAQLGYSNILGEAQ